MKIGIMTFHWATNHGALLQTYALQKYLTKSIPDSEVYVIDYAPPQYDVSFKSCFRHKHPRVIWLKIKELNKEAKLRAFRKRIKTTKRYYSTEQMRAFPPQFDLLICGSDQVWNTSFTLNGEGKKTAAYYLPFQPNARRISYAASFGVVDTREDVAEYIKPLLENFDAISVREKTGAKIIDKLGLHAKVVCDPTFLLPVKEYEDICRGYEPQGEYITKCILWLQSSKVKKIINATLAALGGDKKIRDISKCAIEEWLGTIKNSKFVLTNSFHCVCFCLRFHIPFAIVSEFEGISGQNDRFFTMLNKAGISNRLIDNEEQIPQILHQTIDWDMVDENLNRFAEESKQYLSDACALQPNPKTVNFSDPSECTGCGACIQKCPQQCIAPIKDDEGFVYPKIDFQKCIRCGLCYQVCPIKSAPESIEKSDAFVAMAKDEAVRASSSSGGIFAELAKPILEKNGVVYGAGFDENFTVVHQPAEDLAQLKQLQGSKYVQSDTTRIFSQVKKTLAQGRPVLFCGAPCQVAGLKNYLGKKDDNLTTVDFICHGVPSPAVWQRYLEEHDLKGGKLQSVCFRDKTNGWENYGLKLEFSNGESHWGAQETDPYLKMFYHNLSLRPSCFDCQFKGNRRCADLTLADAWGIQQFAPDMNDGRGTSLVLAHTEKGKTLLKSIEEAVLYKQLPNADVATVYNSAYSNSVPPQPDRAMLFAMFKNGHHSLKTMSSRCCKESMILTAKKKLKRILRSTTGKGVK